jgi:hypothetical protein
VGRLILCQGFFDAIQRLTELIVSGFEVVSEFRRVFLQRDNGIFNLGRFPDRAVRECQHAPTKRHQGDTDPSDE